MVVWWATPVECASAFARLRREGGLTRAEERGLVRHLERLRLSWHEMLPGDRIRAGALRALRVHTLRATDALQLAAALEWADAPDGATLVTFDDRLADAAEKEGFTVVRG